VLNLDQSDPQFDNALQDLSLTVIKQGLKLDATSDIKPKGFEVRVQHSRNHTQKMTHKSLDIFKRNIGKNEISDKSEKVSARSFLGVDELEYQDD
jgi:hypothetical protein